MFGIMKRLMNHADSGATTMKLWTDSKDERLMEEVAHTHKCRKFIWKHGKILSIDKAAGR